MARIACNGPPDTDTVPGIVTLYSLNCTGYKVTSLYLSDNRDAGHILSMKTGNLPFPAIPGSRQTVPAAQPSSVRWWGRLSRALCILEYQLARHHRLGWQPGLDDEARKQRLEKLERL